MGALAYRLFWDMKHIKGTMYDATLVPFEGHEYICGWQGTEMHRLAEPVWFEADLKTTQKSDYPCNDVNWPIMSPRMLDVLRGIGDFPHRLISVRFVDRRARGPARYQPDGTLRPDVVDDRFAVVQLTEHIDVVDWEQSTFRPSQIEPKSGFFEKLTLVEPPDGLPPLFRIPSSTSLLLVSAAARRALESVGIRGVKFMPLRG